MADGDPDVENEDGQDAVGSGAYRWCDPVIIPNGKRKLLDRIYSRLRYGSMLPVA